MTTYQNGRASFTKTSNALTLIPYKHNNGEIQNFDLTKSTQDAAVYTAADPSYLSSQVCVGNVSNWDQNTKRKLEFFEFS